MKEKGSSGLGESYAVGFRSSDFGNSKVLEAGHAHLEFWFAIYERRPMELKH